MSRPFAVTFVQGLVRGGVGGLVPALTAIGVCRGLGVATEPSLVVALGVAFASASIAIGDLRAEVKHGDPAIASFVGGALAPSIGMIPWLSPLGYWAGMRALIQPELWEIGITVLSVLPGLGLGLSRTVAARYVRSATVPAIFLRAVVSATVISSIFVGIHLFVLALMFAINGNVYDVAPFWESLRLAAILYGVHVAIAAGHAAARPVEKEAMKLLEPAEL